MLIGIIAIAALIYIVGVIFNGFCAGVAVLSFIKPKGLLMILASLVIGAWLHIVTGNFLTLAIPLIALIYCLIAQNKRS